MTYGVPNVNEGARGGEFLVGNLNFFQIVTVVPAFATNVKTPLAQALAARNWTSLSASRTITVVDGAGVAQTYNSNTAYTDAYNTQKNLDTLLQVFGTRANPVIVSVSSAAIADGAGATVLAGGVNAVDFGSDFNGAQTGYYINIATERNPAWLVSTVSPTNTNELGYQLLGAMEGVPVLATSTVSVTSFVTGSGAAGRNIIAKVRDEL